MPVVNSRYNFLETTRPQIRGMKSEVHENKTNLLNSKRSCNLVDILIFVCMKIQNRIPPLKIAVWFESANKRNEKKEKRKFVLSTNWVRDGVSLLYAFNFEFVRKCLRCKASKRVNCSHAHTIKIEINWRNWCKLCVIDYY